MAFDMERSEPAVVRGTSAELAEREATRPGVVYRPDVDIAEDPDEVIVWADLPGVASDRLRIHLEDDVLSIDGDPAPVSADLGTPLYAEYRSGGFRRRFTLSERIDAARIRATLRDGVLELRLPKAERHRSRRIEVTA